MSIASEAIYDALVDESLFAALPQVLASAYGARSCVLHWRNPAGDADILAHSQYYSDEQLLNYADHFADTDLWTLAATGSELVNRAWNCDDLVPASVYGNSAFYNDWIRAMGDDTFHCIGSVISSPAGLGMIGLHRGKTQGQFDNANLRALNAGLVHLRRMFSIRGDLIRAERKSAELTALFNALGGALIAVESSGKVRHANAAADELLTSGDCLRVHDGMLKAAALAQHKPLERAVAAAGCGVDPTAQALSLTGKSGRRQTMSFVPYRTSNDQRLVLISIHEQVVQDVTVQAQLRQLYGLSAAEAYIAARLAEGAKLTDIADERHAHPSTVRTQLKTVFAKLSVHRQSELVRLISAIPVLRPSF